jgi:hypothetical protein
MGGLALSVDFSQMAAQRQETLNALDAAGVATARYMVSGTVTDQASAGLAGREVSVEPLSPFGYYSSATTAGDGTYTVAGLPAGDYCVMVADDGSTLAGEYYDDHAKYVAEDTQYLCPGLEGEPEQEIRRLALAAFHAIGCSGWSRVDVMRDKAGKFYLLEVNTAPGMTSHSLVPKAAAQVGIDFETLCWRILETSFKEAPQA